MIDAQSRYNRAFLFQPGFKMDMKYVKSSTDETIMKCKFVTGFEKKYYLGHSPWCNILREINMMNEAFELQRSFAGQDDVPDDEN